MITKISGDGYCRCGRNITVPYVYMDHNLHLACKINNYSLQPSKIIKVVCNVTKKNYSTVILSLIAFIWYQNKTF